MLKSFVKYDSSLILKIRFWDLKHQVKPDIFTNNLWYYISVYFWYKAKIELIWKYSEFMDTPLIDSFMKNKFCIL